MSALLMSVPRPRLRVYAVLALALLFNGALATGSPNLEWRWHVVSPKPLLLTTPVSIVDTLGAAATDVWVLRFSGLTHAQLHVQADGEGAINCSLYDAQGARVRAARGRANSCRFAWIPPRTGAYRVEIENQMDDALPYALRAR